MELNQDFDDNLGGFEVGEDNQNLLQNNKRFNSQMIFNLNMTLQDIPHYKEEFLSKSAEILEAMRDLIISVPNSSISNEAGQFATQLKQKLGELAEKEEEKKALEQEFWTVVVDIFKVLTEKTETQSNIFTQVTKRMLTFNGAFTLSKILKAFISKDSLFTYDFLDLVLLMLNSLTGKMTIFFQESRAWYQIVTKMSGLEQEQIPVFLDDSQRLVKYVFLQYYGSKSGSQQVLGKVMEKFKELVLNDKESQREENFKYFITFIEGLSQETFVSELLPHMEFVMKRNSSLIQMNALIFKHLKAVELNSIVIQQLANEVLTREYLTNDDTFSASCEYCAGIARKVSNTADLNTLIVGYLLQGFTDSRQSSLNQLQRQRYFKVIRSCLESVRQDLVFPELIQQISHAIVDFVYIVKEEQVLKDAFDDYVYILKFNANLAFLNDQLKGHSAKISNYWQVALIPEVLSQQQTPSAEILEALKPKVQQMLGSENYQSAITYNSILALGYFFSVGFQVSQDQGMISPLLENGSFITYLTTSNGFVNQEAFFKKAPGKFEAKWHLTIIKELLVQKYQHSVSSFADNYLLDSLLEYGFNENLTFREHEYFTIVERISASLTDPVVPSFLKHLHIKIKQVSKRTISEDQKTPNLSLIHKVRFIIKTLLKNSQVEIQKEIFFTLLKIICHPFVSRNIKELKSIQQEVDKALLEKATNMEKYFQLHSAELIHENVVVRTGILAVNKNLRATSVNILTLLGIYGYLPNFIQQLTKILDYKSLDLVAKLQRLFEKEFDRITYYDLMFYSEMTKDMLKIFSDSDQKLIQQLESSELASSSPQEGAVEEEKKEEEEEEDVDLAKLLQQSLKKNQDNKKKGAAKKGAQKAPAKAQSKPQAQPQKKQEVKKQDSSQQQQPQITKEQRNKMDRDQILCYFALIQSLKSQQIETVQSVIHNIACCKQAAEFNYMDLILLETLQPCLKLLNFPASRFSTLNFFQNLFSSDQKTCFFKVKNPIVNSIVAISSNRLLQKNMREFQIIFQHLEEHASFSDMDKGYLQFILSMTNFVLKDLSVHLSVKEQALQVTSDILENNHRVQNIDLVRVTINMMKSSYNNDNLSVYLRKLFQKISREEMALILQRLFEYEPIPKAKILEELIRYDQPLFSPIWFTSQLYILQFDDENNKKAKKLWTKNNFELKSAAIELREEQHGKNIFHYLRSKNTNIFDSSVLAFVSGIEKFQERSDLIIEDLIEFYNSEQALIEKFSLQQALQNHQTVVTDASKKIISDERTNRIAAPEILKRAANLVQAHSFKKVFEFLITQGCQDQNEQVQKKSQEAAMKIITEKGSLYADEILKILDKFIHEGKHYSDQSKIHAIILIGVLSPFLDHQAHKILLTTFEKMLELLHNNSEALRQAISRCVSQIARFFNDRARKYLDENFAILKEGEDEKLLRGAAFAVAGLIKGLAAFNEEMLNTIQQNCFIRHADPLRKLSGLYFYEALSFILGKQFEMSAKQVLPNILTCISDQKDSVRKAAIVANKALMNKFSNYAIKQVLPIFLQGLENDQWRSKLASVDALGTMAYCAPKQIAGFLPQIVKGIREVLNDTHEKVHEAALQAIKNIGSVIKCPEIADILDILIKALQNPNAHLKDALKTLLDTSFVHAIDAPSLSLLVPILDSGLMMHDNESKQLASKLMGSICNLTQDPSDLLPYMKILRPAINNSLFDSIPEIRASAAKALGSLSRGLGLENSKEMLEWTRSVLHRKGLTTSERGGAGQGFAEIISVHGIPFFEQIIEEVLTKSRDNDAQLRESFRGVMVFLPTSFEHYVNYLPQLLPTMIEGLSDEFEEVRKISMRSVKTCVKLYARQAPNQLVDPILKMMFEKDFRVRQSSSTLMYQLVKELENDIIKLQPKYISNETKNEILSSMFILKFDTIEKVSIQASQIWKNIIDNPLKVLRAVISDLVSINFKIIQNEYLELQEMGLNCMKGLAEKFGDKIVNDTLNLLETYQERATDYSEVLALTKIVNGMVSSAPLKLLNEFRNRLIMLVDATLSHEQEEIRQLSANAVVVVFQRTYEPLYMTSTLDKLMLNKLHTYVVNQKSNELDYLIDSLKKVLERGSELKLEDKLINLCGIKEMKEPLTVAKARILRAVAPKIAETLLKRKLYQQVMDVLVQELFMEELDDPLRIQEVLNAYSELISHIPEEYMLSINDQIHQFYTKCKERQRVWFYVDLISYFCSNSKKNYEAQVNDYLRNVLVLMNEQDDKLLEKVNTCINSIYAGLSKESQFYLVPVVREVIEEIAVEEIGMRGIYKKKFETLKLFEKPSGIKSFVSVIQNSIMHGSLEIRIDSAICFKYMVDFSKAETLKGDLIKICGALIRVVNDKFPPELKTQIFQTLKLMLIKASAPVKPMAPQLQTTFLKAFTDNLATPLLRKLVIEDLLLLVKTIPKVDPIVKELNTQLDGDKIERDAKIEVSEALALIIRTNGKSIQPALASTIYTTLESILKTKRDQFNDQTITNCAIALAFLSSYSNEGLKAEELFESFDTIVDLRLSLGIKFGLLMNGNATVDKAPLLQQLEQYVLEQLDQSSGLSEVEKNRWVPYDFVGTEEESGNLRGAIEILSYIGDTFVRRFGEPETKRLFFSSFIKSGLIEKVNKQKVLCMESLDILKYVLSNVPVQSDEKVKFEENLALFLQGSFNFAQNFYLEYKKKNDLAPAVLNMLQLNYNNYLDSSDEKQIQVLTPPIAKEHVAREQFQGILSNDMKMIAVELMFL